ALAMVQQQLSALGRLLPQFLLVLGLLVDMPTLRHAFLRYLLRPDRWRVVSPTTLWSDLIRMGLLRCLRGQGVVVGEPFRVAAGWREEELACHLVSAPTDDVANGLAPDGLSVALREA